MIICICRRLNESAVRAAVCAGARNPESVQAHHGHCFNCGKCREAIGQIVADQMDAMPEHGDMVAAE